MARRRATSRSGVRTPTTTSPATRCARRPARSRRSIRCGAGFRTTSPTPSPRRRSSSSRVSATSRPPVARSRRSWGHPIASSRWASATACNGSTTPRRPHHTRRPWRSVASSTSCSSPAGATRGSTWRRWRPSPNASGRSWRSVSRRRRSATSSRRTARSFGRTRWKPPSSPPPIRRAAATPCSCRPAAPASTGIRTVATPHAVIISDGWSPTLVGGRRVDR